MHLKELFNEKEIEYIRYKINNSVREVDNNLGRAKCTFELQPELKEKIQKYISKIYKTDLHLGSSSYVEYNKVYGTPQLPPHFDGDSCDLLLNYQLHSNTMWGIGIDKNIYNLKNNEAVCFSPNDYIHWRPIKTFSDTEYVEMIFFRFFDLNSPSDNSHKRYSLDHEIYKDVNNYRNAIGDINEANRSY